PRLLSRRVQLVPQRLQLGLVLVPDDVDFCIGRNRLELYVWNALANEPVADVVVHRLSARRAAGDLAFFGLTIARVGEEIERVASAHDAGARKRKGDARGVDRDPPT